MKKIYILTTAIFALTLSSKAQNPATCNLVNDDFTNPSLWSHPVLVSNLSEPLN